MALNAPAPPSVHIPPPINGLSALEARARADLELLKYPENPWVPSYPPIAGRPVLDVLIVGAGQGGLSVAAMLLRERVPNIRIIDQAQRGGEGPWRTYARMKTLRSWKTVTGPDLGIASLTFQAWFEARHGAAAFEALSKIAKEDWQDYLLWLRDFLGLPVDSGTGVTACCAPASRVPRGRIRRTDGHCVHPGPRARPGARRRVRRRIWSSHRGFADQ